MSSDEEEDVPPKPTNQVAEVTVEQPISEEEYRRMLRKHRKRRMRSKVGRTIRLITRSPTSPPPPTHTIMVSLTLVLGSPIFSMCRH